MKEILEFIQNAEGLNNVRFAAIMDVAPASISHILSGRNKPSYDFIVKLVETFPQYDARWLITGKGEPYNSTPARGQGAFDFRSTNRTLSEQPATQDGEENTVLPPFVATPDLQTATPHSTSAIPASDRLIVCFPDHTFEEYVKR
ncbi:MAG: helix-turn-helix transcriptional regulator [Tidjanibacter sp.]|nr:helix-turn-helix transcriptional regulator [Tidjanibacter sp.]